MLAAGLEGIEHRYDLPLPADKHVFMMTAEERRKRGIQTLPRSLGEALKLAERSELVKKALGDHVFESFIHNKRIEWERYQEQVTDYEIKKYLPIL